MGFSILHKLHFILLDFLYEKMLHLILDWLALNATRGMKSHRLTYGLAG